MSAKILGEAEFGPEFGLRPNTPIKRWIINFIFNEGGLGDFVNYTAATVWVARNSPWVEGRLFVPKYLVPLLKDIHEEFGHWEVIPSELASERLEEGTSIIGPGIIVGGRNISPQYLNCMGAHPIDVAYSYYAHSSPAPPDLKLPMLDYPAQRLLPSVKRLRGQYAVIPTGAVSPARQVYGRHINPLIDHLRSRDITPVFLGKSSLMSNGQITTQFADDIDYSKGLDLRDQTGIKDAATIMQHALVTVGLDCGLLHLAALMKNSRLVFGYNVTSVAHREPRRDHGRHVNIHLTKQDLACAECQSTLKNIAVHKFDHCLYGDNKCVDLLFANGASRWIRAVDEVLK